MVILWIGYYSISLWSSPRSLWCSTQDHWRYRSKILPPSSRCSRGKALLAHASHPLRIALCKSWSTLVLRPILFDVIEVAVVERFLQRVRALIVQYSMARELVITPVAFIRDFPWLIVQLPEPFHLAADPLSIVHASILVVELPMSMSHSVQLVSLVLAAHLKDLYDVFPKWIGELSVWLLLAMVDILARPDRGSWRLVGDWTHRWQLGVALSVILRQIGDVPRIRLVIIRNNNEVLINACEGCVATGRENVAKWAGMANITAFYWRDRAIRCVRFVV